MRVLLGIVIVFLLQACAFSAKPPKVSKPSNYGAFLLTGKCNANETDIESEVKVLPPELVSIGVGALVNLVELGIDYGGKKLKAWEESQPQRTTLFRPIASLPNSGECFYLVKGAIAPENLKSESSSEIDNSTEALKIKLTNLHKNETGTLLFDKEHTNLFISLVPTYFRDKKNNVLAVSFSPKRIYYRPEKKNDAVRLLIGMNTKTEKASKESSGVLSVGEMNLGQMLGPEGSDGVYDVEMGYLNLYPSNWIVTPANNIPATLSVTLVEGKPNKVAAFMSNLYSEHSDSVKKAAADLINKKLKPEDGAADKKDKP